MDCDKYLEFSGQISVLFDCATERTLGLREGTYPTRSSSELDH